MFWFLLHNFLQQFTNPNITTDQTRNLTTFVLGTLIHTIVYSYLGSLQLETNPFLKTFHGFYLYIVIADAIAIAIIYKNYYNSTILTEMDGLFSKKPANIVTEEPEEFIANP